jgi:hypothetical protein
LKIALTPQDSILAISKDTVIETAIDGRQVVRLER